MLAHNYINSDVLAQGITTRLSEEVSTFERHPRRHSLMGLSTGVMDSHTIFEHSRRMSRSASLSALNTTVSAQSVTSGGKASEELFSYLVHARQPKRTPRIRSSIGSRASLGSCGSVKSFAE